MTWRSTGVMRDSLTDAAPGGPGQRHSHMDFIQLLEQSAPMVWMREGGSLWGYPAILFAHTLGLGTVAGVCGAIGLRFLGFARRIPLPALQPMFALMWAAFAVTAVSGLVLLMADASNKLASPVFYVKMLFVALALVCVTRLKGAVAATADTGSGANGRVWALAAMFCWAAAITGGRLMAYLGPIG